MKITVVTPTAGKRASLEPVVQAVGKLLLPGDQHLIIHDATVGTPPPKFTPTPFTQFKRKYISYSVFGNGQRDYAVSLATGDCIVYIDDDDYPGKRAFDILHATEGDPDVVHYFRMFGQAGLFPANVPQVGKMGGPQCVPPVRLDLPHWLDQNVYEADGHFLIKCHTLYKPVYHPEIICYIRGVLPPGFTEYA